MPTLAEQLAALAEENAELKRRAAWYKSKLLTCDLCLHSSIDGDVEPCASCDFTGREGSNFTPAPVPDNWQPPEVDNANIQP